MNALVAKEIRLLLPAYVMALVLAIVPVWLLPMDSHNTPAAIALYPFAFGAVMLALSSFGREFVLKTFPWILAQPLERNRIWRTKITVLAGAMATVLGAWCLSCAICVYAGLGKSVWRETLMYGGTAAMVTLAGGLWTTLLLRQMTAAFWFTLLIPGAILMAVGLSDGTDTVAFTAMGLYSVAGFWYARREFLRVEETGWTGGDISFRGWRRAEAVARSTVRVRRPFAALLWKEFQLHQVGLGGMACLFVLHLGVVFLRQHDFGDTVRKGLEVFGGIWLMVPLLVGGQSVAEERKLGTWAAHLTLPVSSRFQFAIKVFFALIVGGLLSLLLLVTAETMATAIGTGSDVGILKMPPDGPLIALLFVSFPVLALIGFYASTLTRSLVQALAVAVLTIIGIGALGFIFSSPVHVVGVPAWRGSLIYYVAWPMFALTFLWLTYRNFKCVLESWLLWRRNALALVAVLAGVTVLTTVVYHRLWELLSPLEPAHGPARLTRATAPQLRSYGGRELAVILPDGRLWLDCVVYDPGRLLLSLGEHTETGIRVGGKWTSLIRNPIVAGSNWVDVVASFREAVGIRSDGTLWVSEKLPREWGGEGPLPPAGEAPLLVRFGDQTNWQSVVREDYSMLSVLLLKHDGTLWRWGTNSWASRKSSGLRAFQPGRLGNESDWAKICSDLFGAYAWKSDGTAWVSNARIGTEMQLNGVKIRSATNITALVRVTSFDNIQWRSVAGSWPWRFGIREDGTLWVWNSIFHPADRGDDSLTTQLTQIGTDNDWSAVASDFGTLAGLKANGTLWVWSLGVPSGDQLREDRTPASEAPLRLGTHDDWVAVGGAMGGIVSLAADGSLWYWSGSDRESYRNSDQPLLAASRRPARIANIFDSQ